MLRVLVASGMAVALIGYADVASALPKRTYNGCTQAQLQTSEAGQCLGHVLADMTSGKTYTHVVYCDSGGHILCCLQDNQTGRTLDNSCDTLTLRGNAGAITKKPSGAVMSP